MWRARRQGRAGHRRRPRPLDRARDRAGAGPSRRRRRASTTSRLEDEAADGVAEIEAPRAPRRRSSPADVSDPARVRAAGGRDRRGGWGALTSSAPTPASRTGRCSPTSRRRRSTRSSRSTSTAASSAARRRRRRCAGRATAAGSWSPRRSTRCMPSPTLGVYGATKHAVAHLVWVMAREWAADGITVNHVGPGWVDSRINDRSPDFATDELRAAVRATIPLRHRPIEPREIGEAVAYFAVARRGADHRRVPARRRRLGDREVLMQRCCVHGADQPLEAALAGRAGLELVPRRPTPTRCCTLGPPPRAAAAGRGRPGGVDRALRRLGAGAVLGVPGAGCGALLERGAARAAGWRSPRRSGAQPFPGGGADGASAVALQTLVRIAAVEYGSRGMRANAIAAGWRARATARPGSTRSWPSPTPRPAGWSQTPTSPAAIAWLLSDDADQVNGEILRLDGGYTITAGARPDPRTAMSSGRGRSWHPPDRVRPGRPLHGPVPAGRRASAACWSTPASARLRTRC